MQAITTKYAGPTNNRGARVLAKSWIKNKARFWQYDESLEVNHRRAAEELVDAINADRMKAGHDDYVWMIIASGNLPDNSGSAFIIELLPNNKEKEV